MSIITRQGYVAVFEPTHPLAMRYGYVLEHRKVAWDSGLLVDPANQVHHRNGVKVDNRLENLEVLTAAEHGRHHAEAAGVIVNQYGTAPLKPPMMRQGAPRPARQCPECGAPFSFERRRDAVFCTDGCRVRAWKRLARPRAARAA